MSHLTMDSIVNLLFNFSFYFIIGSFGSFLKDLHETLTKKNERIRLGEILIGGVCSTFISLAIQERWMPNAGINTMVCISFVLGILGFEIFGNITSISGLKRFISELYYLKTTSPSEWQNRIPENTNHHNNEEPIEEKSSEEPSDYDESTTSKRKQKTPTTKKQKKGEDA